MDDRIKSFIDQLRGAMSGLPQREIDDAVQYYEEYLSDALEAGKDLDTVFAELEQPGQIAAVIRAEASIAKAQQSPNIRSFSGALANTMRAVTTPFTVFLLILCFIPSIILVGVFFITAAALFISAIVVAFGMLYAAVGAAPNMQGFLGSLGIGLFTAGILLLCAYAFYLLAALMIRLSVLMIRRISKKPGQYRPEPESSGAKRKPLRKRALLILYLSIVAAGLLALSISGLPLKYFAIFNSMEASNIELRTMTYDISGIDRLSIRTTHTNIRLVRGNTDAITLTYEQVDWLDFDAGVSGTTLAFSERSNNTMPLFQLVQLHQNSADLVITLPADLDPMSIEVESYGGYIYSGVVSADISVKTTSGSIFITTSNDSPSNIHAVTGSGTIDDGGSQGGIRTEKGLEYTRNNGSEYTIDARSAAGSIYISRSSQ